MLAVSTGERRPSAGAHQRVRADLTMASDRPRCRRRHRRRRHRRPGRRAEPARDRRRRRRLRGGRRDPARRRRHQPAPPLDPRARRARPARRAAHAARSQPTTLGYFAKNGREIWSEPRGLDAGYRWPQLSIHRGELHRILLDAATSQRRRRPRSHLGHRLLRSTPARPRVGQRSRAAGRHGGRTCGRAAVIAADGIHSVGAAPALSRPGTTEVERRLLWRGIVERRAGARRPHDDLDRPPGPEVRRLPDRRPRRRPPDVQLHRRTRVRTMQRWPTARTGTAQATSPTSCRRSRTGCSTGSTCRR